MEPILISCHVVQKTSGALYFGFQFFEKRLISHMAASMLDVKTIFKADFSKDCLFIAASTNETQVANKKTTELPTMMTNWMSYRKNTFVRHFVFKWDFCSRAVSKNARQKTEIHPRQKLFQFSVVVSASKMHLPNKKFEGKAIDVLVLTTSSGILCNSVIWFIVFEAKVLGCGYTMMSNFSLSVLNVTHISV